MYTTTPIEPVVLSVRHETVYRYRRPIMLGPHRLMLRPRDSRMLRIAAHRIDIVPSARLSWSQDVFGNEIATAVFDSLSTELHITGETSISLVAPAWPVFDIAAYAMSYPFLYRETDRIDLGMLAVPAHAGRDDRVRDWVRGFIRSDPTDTLALLKDLCAGVADRIGYQPRDDEGTQSPLQTLERCLGSCRDFAVLFAESARSLGFGARIVSGYLYNPRELAGNRVGSGTTHAWAEAYVPGAGWISFDPTNRSVGSANLIPVAAGRTIDQVMPVTGSFNGMTDAFESMTVDVQVDEMSAYDIARDRA